MTPPLQSVASTDGVGPGGRRSAASWSGIMTLKLPIGLRRSSSEVMLMDIEPQGKEETLEDVVFSAEYDIAYEEAYRCFSLLQWRESLFFVRRKHYTRDNLRDEVYERLCALRYKDCKILMGDDLDNPARVKLLAEYPAEGCPWDRCFELGPSIFGWTYDPVYFDLVDLDDYQRILPTRADIDEYRDWEKYRLTFSRYEADLEYVKYCDELSNKIKWVEECIRLDYKEFADKFEYRALKQAVKIAVGFPLLTDALAKRGYEEYVLSLLYNLDTKDYVRVYFEVWKRVYKQKMSFEDALKLALPAFHYSCNTMILCQLMGDDNMMRHEFETCMDHIPRHVVEDDKVFEHINDAVYEIKSTERPKLYLDYVKKKLEVAQRLQLFPGNGFCIGKD